MPSSGSVKNNTENSLSYQFAELNITSGELLFEGASLDHVDPDGKP
jgi:hypothetical protein